MHVDTLYFTAVMVLFVFLLLILLCLIPSFHQGGKGKAVYLSREHTSLVNGVFIWFVFLAHFSGYGAELCSPDNTIMKGVGGILSQLMVAPFFFFSGWGMMSSLQRKGKEYARQVLVRRFPGLWLKFGVAVLIFTGVQAILGIYYPWGRVIISMTAWLRVGNSNWFIFMTLLVYVLVAGWFAFLPVRRQWIGVLGLSATLAVVIFVLSMLKASYWYDTVMCVPAGMFFRCIYNAFSVSWLRRGGLYALITIPVGWFMYFHGREWVDGMPVLEVWSGNMLVNAGVAFFALGVALLTGSLSLLAPRLSTGGRWLAWCGGPALFYLYIYQRIPMLVGRHFGIEGSHPYVYLIACIFITMLMALLALKCSKK